MSDSRSALCLLVAGTMLAGCASQKLHNHAKNIDAVQLAFSFVKPRARVLTTPTLDMELLETLAMDPVFAIGKAGVLEKALSQPGHVRQSISKLMTETIKSFPVAKSDYSLDTRVPLYGFVGLQDEGGGRFFVIVSSSLAGPQGRLWNGRVMGVSPKTSFSAVVNGKMNLQEGLSLALRDASSKIDSALTNDSKPPQ